MWGKQLVVYICSFDPIFLLFQIIVIMFRTYFDSFFLIQFIYCYFKKHFDKFVHNFEYFIFSIRLTVALHSSEFKNSVSILRK